jgi:hypothetical protein
LEKVVITKAQAEALEHWLETFTGGKEELVKTHILGEEWVDESEALNGLSLERLIVALYIGYEVYQSPEEQIKSYYENLVHSRNFASATAIGGRITHEEWQREIYGVEKTLDFLNIKIDGVNC